MRWYGPPDPVSLTYLRQAGSEGLFTSLHEVPYGEVWSRESIRERKAVIEAGGLSWLAVESVPVHEDIKTGNGNVGALLENYSLTLRNLSAEGIHLVVYNFMPVLDWIRTDVQFRLEDNSEALRFDPAQFAAFDMYALGRTGAERDYSQEEVVRARTWWQSMPSEEKDAYVRGIIDVFPGCKLGLGLEDVRRMLAEYSDIGREDLLENLRVFLNAVVPVAEEVGVRLAIHPDDPPFPVLGLPRVVSTQEDVARILEMVDSPSNGLCYCTGSFSARADNDLVEMAADFAPRIHAVHLRSTQRLPDGSFYEASHLEGTADMPAIVQVLLDESTRRKSEGRPDWAIPFRPDHGHRIMDDLEKPSSLFQPGYSCLGRMRGLAELRGLIRGLRYRKPEIPQTKLVEVPTSGNVS